MDRTSVKFIDDEIKTKKVTLFEKFLSAGMQNNEIQKYKYGEVPIDMYIDAREDEFIFIDKQENLIESIQYNQMDCVNLSLVFRLRSPDRRASLSYRYPVLLDIVTKDKTYYLEVFYPNYLQKLIDQLQRHQVDCIDIVGVIDIYKKYPDIYERDRYLRLNYESLAKKYDLEFIK